MNIKKIIIQVLVAMLLFVGISLVIEGVYTEEMIYSKVQSALIFGAVYAIYIGFRERVKGNNK